MNFFSECGTFWRESRRQFRNTGALLPSSRFLARALASPLAITRPPRRILEVGPGTGSVTRGILRRLQPGDRLDCVEVNEHFVERLNLCFRHDPRFVPYQDQVQVIHCPIEALPGEGIYDHIISGLPLNNFPVDLVQDIFDAFSRLMKPNGVLSYFEYALVRHLKTPFSSRVERRRLHSVGRLVGRYIDAYQIHRQRVLMNVPPAVVRHLHLKPATGSPPLAAESNGRKA